MKPQITVSNVKYISNSNQLKSDKSKFTKNEDEKFKK